MGDVTAADIAAEQRVFGPGLGDLQARNRIIQRRYFAAQHSRGPVASNWIK